MKKDPSLPPNPDRTFEKKSADAAYNDITANDTEAHKNEEDEYEALFEATLAEALMVYHGNPPLMTHHENEGEIEVEGEHKLDVCCLIAKNFTGIRMSSCHECGRLLVEA
ncbi:MAG: hypothetical protein FWC40_06705 [Proteobacteria bacterium]|nr:hypothetical protein [Pseudomonadota bacterium]